ncbi:GNAT family acetyltransferase [Paenibacillus chitinolyticus]|uniref:GNAT family N-acetyltransferase n=1 Tax=Paenibacillus chitinolyticus TaxID=79263 RepID=UPI0026E50063|nr:GNAT family N-acetyltransferase [Paenibacillus chitinolyticus]GKS13219.1 GNAT family acetyltransferase [Paenibacillus chitinolyticus]
MKSEIKLLNTEVDGLLMENYKWVSDYRNNKDLRESFNELAIKSFEIDFRGWYNKGYWNDKYIPYSFVDEGKVIANASIYKISVVINGKTYNGIQIGTVMTDIHYRGKGLAKQLLWYIMQLYKDSCDFIYLFANASVLDFYPKYGFIRLDESEYSLILKKSSIKRKMDSRLKKLIIEEDLALLENFAKNRYINSMTLDVKHNEALLMFYFTVVFSEAIFYIEDLETIVLMKHEEEILHVFDVISLNQQNIEAVLETIILESTKKVVLHFTPASLIEGMEVITMPDDDDALFVLSDKPLLNGNFKFPITSHC